MMRCGLSESSAFGPMPISSSVPGRKFSMNTCAVATSLRSRSMPSGARRFKVTLFLLRA